MQANFSDVAPRPAAKRFDVSCSLSLAMGGLVVLTTIALTGCGSSPMKSSARTSPPMTPQQQASQRLQSEKDQFIAAAQRRLDEISHFERDLRDRAIRFAQSQGQGMKHAAEDLESSLSDARTRLNDVRAASADNWVDYRRDLDRALKRASNQYRESKARFR